MLPSSKLQIAFNSSCMHPDAIGGWARYTRSLIDSLRERHSDEVEIHEFWNENKRIHTVWEQIGLPRSISDRSIDVFHAPANGGLPLILSKVPSVLTVHDLFSEEDFFWSKSLASLQTLKAAIRYKLDWWASIRRCTKIIAVSEYTKEQLLLTGIPAHKVTVIYEGISNRIKYRDRKYRDFATNSYVLYVGTTAPRKRVDNLVAHFLAAQLGLRLVIVGPAPAPEFTKRNSITYLSQLSDDELSSLYSHALAFVTFSEKEGFGLPLIEALACGAPVLFTGGGSISEIVGQAGVKIEEVQLGKTLHDLLDSPKSLLEMKAQARARATRFSWESCARQTLDLYKSVANSAKRSSESVR